MTNDRSKDDVSDLCKRPRTCTSRRSIAKQNTKFLPRWFLNHHVRDLCLNYQFCHSSRRRAIKSQANLKFPQFDAHYSLLEWPKSLISARATSETNFSIHVHGPHCLQSLAAGTWISCFSFYKFLRSKVGLARHHSLCSAFCYAFSAAVCVPEFYRVWPLAVVMNILKTLRDNN